MNEDSILKKISLWCEPTKLSSTLVGVGDDAAVLSSTGRALVFASDLTIENTHFDLKFSTPADVGYKSVARVLSDIAAMGAAPVAITISIALPHRYDAAACDRFLELYFKGATEIALNTETALAGGDLSRVEGPVIVDVAGIGELREGMSPWLRSAARLGDTVFVTGALGGAAFALEEFLSNRGGHLRPEIAAQHLRPKPRFDVGARFAGHVDLPMGAAMDISDGLVRDAYRMCEASNVSIELTEANVPLAPGAGLSHALYGGDDYQLLFTLAPQVAERARGLLSHVGAIAVGSVIERPESREVLLQRTDGTRITVASPTLTPAGHDPFRDVTD